MNIGTARLYLYTSFPVVFIKLVFEPRLLRHLFHIIKSYIEYENYVLDLTN